MSHDGFTPEFTPVEINYLRDDRILEIVWDDDVSTRLSAELLRVESPSAEVQGTIRPRKRSSPVAAMSALSTSFRLAIMRCASPLMTCMTADYIAGTTCVNFTTIRTSFGAII